MAEQPEEGTSNIAVWAAAAAIAAVLAGFIIISFFPRNDPNVIGGYNALTIIALILTITFASFLADALSRRRATWRSWATLLGAMVAVWAGGTALFLLLPRP